MLYVQETYINATEQHIIGESEVYETFTDSPTELYRAMQREYGRCTGKVRIDTTEGDGIPVGWVFIGRDTYSDSSRNRSKSGTYLREVWVTVRDAPDSITRERHYHHLSR